ncbi:MAG: LysR family transcriptional regulator [Chloroflexota bacterium]
MLLVHIEGFLEVARLGSVSRAAEALYVTQPTLTARLHSLERDMGHELFVRTRHGMRLSDEGRALLPYAERAVRALRDGRRAIDDVSTGMAGQLVLGVAPHASTYLLPPALERFVAVHSRVEIAVRTGHSEEVQQMVLKDEVQLGIGRALKHPDVELIPFHEEELVLVVAPAHPFARRSDVAMADVGGQQLIMFDRTSSYYEITTAAFVAAGVQTRSMMELDNIEAAKKMVERGLGVALLPRTAVDREAAAGALRVVKVSDAPPMKRSIVAMRRRDSGPPSGLVAAFLEVLVSRPK